MKRTGAKLILPDMLFFGDSGKSFHFDSDNVSKLLSIISIWIKFLVPSKEVLVEFTARLIVLCGASLINSVKIIIPNSSPV